MAAVEGEVEDNVEDEKDIRKVVLLENGKGQNGNVFEFFFMNYEFVYLSKMGNHWNKGENYPMHRRTSVELTHTVAKVFVANNLNHVGYVVLKDVTEDSTDPQLLYYFSEIRPAQHERTSLKQAKDYAFYLGDKKYDLAADGTITEAKKEEPESAKEPQDDVVETESKKKKSFLKNKNFGSFLSSFSSTPEVGEPIDKSQQKKGKRLFNFKSSSSLFSAASNSDIEDASLSPEKDRASSVSPKIEFPIEIERASSASPKIESPLNIERASSASPKINRSVFGK
jgi:hypothetical protein